MMEHILTQTPKEIVEDAIYAAMLTDRIPKDFGISKPVLEGLYKTIEGYITREDHDGIYTAVTTFLVAYALGWRDAEHKNKNFTKYSDYKSE